MDNIIYNPQLIYDFGDVSIPSIQVTQELLNTLKNYDGIKVSDTIYIKYVSEEEKFCFYNVNGYTLKEVELALETNTKYIVIGGFDTYDFENTNPTTVHLTEELYQKLYNTNAIKYQNNLFIKTSYDELDIRFNRTYISGSLIVVEEYRVHDGIISFSRVTTGLEQDYANLVNKPRINNVELNGNQTSIELGLQAMLTAGTGIDITNNIISVAPDFRFKILVVLTLPETGEINTIYLVPNNTFEVGNYYDEYLWINQVWELIGNTQIDLSDYYTKSETNALLGDKCGIITLSSNQGTLTQEQFETMGSGAVVLHANKIYVKYEQSNSQMIFKSVNNWHSEQINSKTVGINTSYNLIVTINNRNYEFTETNSDAYYTSTIVDNMLGAKQDTLVSGTNIKTLNGVSLLGSGNIEVSSRIFYGLYGVTTFNEIANAINNGKTPIVAKDSSWFYYYDSSNSEYTFFTMDVVSGIAKYVKVLSNDNWLYDYKTFQQSSYMVQSITASSTAAQYPSAKAVYDYVNPIDEALKNPLTSPQPKVDFGGWVITTTSQYSISEDVKNLLKEICDDYYTYITDSNIYLPFILYNYKLDSIDNARNNSMVARVKSIENGVYNLVGYDENKIYYISFSNDNNRITYYYELVEITNDYNDLTNKPSINNIELSGNKSLSDLNIQEKLTFDLTPTDNSSNPVTSNGVKTYVDRANFTDEIINNL